MASSKLTMIGLYNYCLMNGDDLFVNLNLPADIDKNECINNMLMRCGEFEVLYPDVDFLKLAIGTWSYKMQRTFEKWSEALKIEYNPLENYDRKEDWLTQDDGKNKTKTQAYDAAFGRSNSDTTGKVSAYDADTLVNDNESIVDMTNQNNTASNSNVENENVNNNFRTGRAHGNIGVTTSQQMLESELDIARWNLLDQIADLFVSEFCLMVY